MVHAGAVDQLTWDLSSFYKLYCVYDKKREEDFELVKEVSIRVLRECGWWSCTAAFADIATGIVRAQCNASNPASDLTSVTVDSLEPGTSKRSLGYLRYLDSAKKKQLFLETDMALLHVDSWMWSEEVPPSDRLMSLLHEVSLLLEDVRLHSQL